MKAALLFVPLDPGKEPRPELEVLQAKQGAVHASCSSSP